MKNIHLIPTDKPSRLYKHLGRELKHTVRYFEQKGLLCINQHIYITNDEKIKDGDWSYDIRGFIEKIDESYDLEVINVLGKKIILTTDQDLIADGVQPIDDEFLEWFVKNPSCEFVKFEREKSIGYTEDRARVFYGKLKIIIPQEEPKITNCGNKNCQSGVINGVNPKICRKCNPQEEPKQEENEIIDISDHDGIGNAVDNLNNEPPQETTIEEAAKKQWGNVHRTGVLGFIDGAKWQQERMYSEEEVIDFLQEMNDWPTTFEGRIDIREWFEQFKKK